MDVFVLCSRHLIAMILRGLFSRQRSRRGLCCIRRELELSLQSDSKTRHDCRRVYDVKSTNTKTMGSNPSPSNRISLSNRNFRGLTISANCVPFSDRPQHFFEETDLVYGVNMVHDPIVYIQVI